MEGLEGKTREKEVAVIQARGDQRVDQDGVAVGGEGGTEMVDVTQMEVCRPGDVPDVGLE